MKNERATYINPKFNLNLQKPENTPLVSYTQFSSFSKCPLSWKLSYIDNLRNRESTIHTLFGNAIHTTIQYWIRMMYTTTIKKANEISLSDVLMEEMKREYIQGLDRSDHFSTKEELAEFYVDGVEILSWIKKKRSWYFNPRSEVLIGTEVPIVIEDNGITLLAYLDMVRQRKDTGEYIITDFKTSTRGWNDSKKKDKVTTSQLLLYKLYFSKQYGIPLENIRVEYLILKRKLYEESEFPQRRVQVFEPAQGKPSYKKIEGQFSQFLSSCFLPDGSYNTSYDYVAIAGLNNSNCKYCEYRDRQDLCPPINRKLA